MIKLMQLNFASVDRRVMKNSALLGIGIDSGGSLF
jgi:hypothetical protein